MRGPAQFFTAEVPAKYLATPVTWLVPVCAVMRSAESCWWVSPWAASAERPG